MTLLGLGPLGALGGPWGAIRRPIRLRNDLGDYGVSIEEIQYESQADNVLKFKESLGQALGFNTAIGDYGILITFGVVGENDFSMRSICAQVL